MSGIKSQFSSSRFASLTSRLNPLSVFVEDDTVLSLEKILDVFVFCGGFECFDDYMKGESLREEKFAVGGMKDGKQGTGGLLWRFSVEVPFLIFHIEIANLVAGELREVGSGKVLSGIEEGDKRFIDQEFGDSGRKESQRRTVNSVQ